MIVCVCRQISDREIARRAHAGMRFDEISSEFAVATRYGQGEGYARDVVAGCSASCLQAHIKLATPTPEGSPWNPSHQSTHSSSPFLAPSF